MKTSPQTPNSVTAPDAEDKTSVRQLLDSQEFPVAKGDIIKKGLYHKAAVERWVVYLHGISQLPSCPSYTGERITSSTCLQLLHMDNNAMLGAAQFMVDL